MSTTLNLTRVQSLMQDLGPLVSDIEVLLQQDDNHWLIQSHDGLKIDIAYCEKPSRLMFSTAVGCPDAAQVGDMHITMLCTNLLFAEEHSLRVALTHPGGEYLLISELVLEDYAIDILIQMLTDYLQQVRYFCELISSSNQTDAEAMPLPQIAGRV